MLDVSMRERFGKMLESAGQFYWELDRDFIVLFTNELTKRVFNDPVGLTRQSIMGSDDSSCEECPVKKVFQGVERVVSEQMTRDAQGNSIWLQSTSTPIKNEAGEIVGVRELIIDTTPVSYTHLTLPTIYSV